MITLLPVSTVRHCGEEVVLCYAWVFHHVSAAYSGPDKQQNGVTLYFGVTKVFFLIIIIPNREAIHVQCRFWRK